MAFLVLLEALSPVERAVFTLREVFGYGYPDVARITGKTEVTAGTSSPALRPRVRQSFPRHEKRPDSKKRSRAAGCWRGLDPITLDDRAIPGIPATLKAAGRLDDKALPDTGTSRRGRADRVAAHGR